MRLMDRGFSKKMEGDEMDSVRTKKFMQNDVIELNSGDQIQSYNLFAQVFTSLLVTFMYGSGMPILYPIAFLNFVCLYWTYKYLLVKFYSKTVAFNQDLPIFCIKYFHIAVILHLLVALMMLTQRGLLNIDYYFSSEGDIRQNFIKSADASGGHRLKFIANRMSHSIGVIYIFTVGFVVGIFILRQSFVLFGYWALKQFYKCTKSQTEKMIAEVSNQIH